MRTPLAKHFASAFGGHARAEAVTALAYQFARLIGPLHCNGSPLAALKVSKYDGLARDFRGL